MITACVIQYQTNTLFNTFLTLLLVFLVLKRLKKDIPSKVFKC